MSCTEEDTENDLYWGWWVWFVRLSLHTYLLSKLRVCMLKIQQVEGMEITWTQQHKINVKVFRMESVEADKMHC